MSRLKLIHGVSRVHRAKLQSSIDQTVADDIELLAQWSNNETNYVINEMLRFALAQEEDFQKYKTTVPPNSAKPASNARIRWLEQRERELLPTRYVHAVFTLPREPAPLALQNKRLIYGLLFRNSAATLLEVAREERKVWGDGGYQDQTEAIREAAPKAQDMTCKRTKFRHYVDELQKKRI